MKKSIVLFFAIFAIIFSIIVLGCKENEDFTDENTNTSEIIVGDYFNMLINFYDAILIGSYNEVEYFNIDIDNDGIEDISLQSEIWGSPAIGGNPRSKIISLNENIQLHGFYANDTSFLNRDTSIYSGANNSIEFYYRYNYTCHQIDKNDSILQINQTFKLTPLDREDVLKTSDTFKSAAITLIDDGYRLPEYVENYGGDTVIYSVTTYYKDCDAFPMYEIKYIGLKFENDSRLGWVKVCIFDKYKVLILESGIQK